MDRSPKTRIFREVLKVTKFLMICQITLFALTRSRVRVQQLSSFLYLYHSVLSQQW